MVCLDPRPAPPADVLILSTPPPHPQSIQTLQRYKHSLDDDGGSVLMGGWDCLEGNCSILQYYNMVPDGIIFWFLFFSVPLGKSSFTSFIFQTRLADSCLLAACLLSEPVQESYSFLFTSAVTCVLATTYSVFSLLLVTKQYPCSISTSSNRILEFTLLTSIQQEQSDPFLYVTRISTRKGQILQLSAIAPPLNRVAALDSRRNRPPSIRPTLRL